MKLSLALFATAAVALSIQNPFSSNANAGKDDTPIPGDSPISKCDVYDAQLLDIKSVTIDPNPPARGENLTIVAHGVLDKPVEAGAYVDVDVTYGYIKLVHDTYDLCDELTEVSMQCPVAKGSYKITKEVAIPNEVPPGKYTVVARAYTKLDELISCLSAVVEFPQFGGVVDLWL